jgi:uncharacterized protein
MHVTRRTALRALVATAAGTLTGAATYGVAYARHDLVVTRASLPVAGLPAALRGLRVGLMTDLHHGPFVSQADLASAVALLMAERPDLVVLAGDYVNWQDRRYVGSCAEALASLRPPHGVFAVLGNHDDERFTPPALERRGIAVLMDERTRVAINGQSLELAGLRYWTRRIGDITAVVRGAAATLLLVAHDPRRLVEAAALDVPAVLSGHTHGGQVVLPVVGAVAARKFPLVAGIGRRARTSIFVSRGIGTIVVPYRLNCPPEVALLTLERQSEASPAGSVI